MSEEIKAQVPEIVPALKASGLNFLLMMLASGAAGLVALLPELQQILSVALITHPWALPAIAFVFSTLNGFLSKYAASHTVTAVGKALDMTPPDARFKQ